MEGEKFKLPNVPSTSSLSRCSAANLAGTSLEFAAFGSGLNTNFFLLVAGGGKVQINLAICMFLSRKQRMVVSNNIVVVEKSVSFSFFPSVFFFFFFFW